MDKQDRQMEAFVEQQLEIFQDDATPVENLAKPVLELNRPDVATIQDKYYWISGQAEVYLLNTENFLAYKMTPVEIEEMPVDLIYSGQEKTNFLVDEKRAMEIILLILLKVNVMQSSEIYSFPLASFSSHLASFLYRILVVKYRYFSTQIVMSGSGSTPRTGKSLMTSCWQLAFLGHWPKQAIKFTEASLFEHLNSGQTFYLREWAKHTDILNVIIPMVWEQLGKDCRTGFRHVNAPVMIEGNLHPDDIKFTTANDTKCIFLATGSTPLQHKNMMKLCKEVEELGRELHSYLPVLIGLGLKTMLDVVTDDELEVYEGILRKDGDPREGQVMVNYDRVHSVLEDAIDRFDLEKPLLFQKSSIDRTALTFFTKREDKHTPEQMAETVAQHMLEEGLKDAVEYCQRSRSFRLKIPMSGLPGNVSKALKGCSKEMVTMFAGKKTRLRVMDSALLEGDVLKDLKALGQSYNFTDLALRMLDEREERREKLGREFYKQIKRLSLGHGDPKPGVAGLAMPDDIPDIPDEVYNVEEEVNISDEHEEPTEFRCTVEKCRSYTHKFKSEKTYKFHLKSPGHLEAMKKPERKRQQRKVRGKNNEEKQK